MRILLWDLNYLLVLVPAKTGIQLQQQCGGTSCIKQSMEGFMIPLQAPPKREDDGFLDFGPAPYDRLQVATWLKTQKVDAFFEPLQGAEAEAAQTMEAWLPVRVRKRQDTAHPGYLDAIRDMRVILTYPNSD